MSAIVPRPRAKLVFEGYQNVTNVGINLIFLSGQPLYKGLLLIGTTLDSISHFVFASVVNHFLLFSCISALGLPLYPPAPTFFFFHHENDVFGFCEAPSGTLFLFFVCLFCAACGVFSWHTKSSFVTLSKSNSFLFQWQKKNQEGGWENWLPSEFCSRGAVSKLETAAVLKNAPSAKRLLPFCQGCLQRLQLQSPGSL